ncbi:MAG: hypothetical protein IJ940_08355, partial [Bacteroidales bacterium]|nr:hypothetical protein [Bacteroidales bacterium]
DKRIQEELATKAQEAMEVKLEKVAKQQALIDLMQNDKEVYDRQYALYSLCRAATRSTYPTGQRKIITQTTPPLTKQKN